jgi:hypothetical protein
VSRRVDRLLFILLTGVVLALLVITGGCASFDAWATKPVSTPTYDEADTAINERGPEANKPTRTQGEVVVDGARSVLELVNPFAALGVGLAGSWILAGARQRQAQRRAPRSGVVDLEPSR